ncbi:hypothetical protein DFH27DRAFT_609303 [Peziza echinospora]|nr:hypothetical protein DFH27DRAFT_609303 [Peziza echinospora]
MSSQYGTSINGSPSPRASIRKGDTQRMRTSTLTGRKRRDGYGTGAAESSYLAGRTTNWQQDDTENDMSGFSTINVSTLRRHRSPSPAFSTIKTSGPLFTSRASRRRLLPDDHDEGTSFADSLADQTQVPNTVDVGALEDFSELSVVQQYRDDPKYSSQLANSYQSRRNSVNASRNNHNNSLFDETQQTQIPATPAVEARKLGNTSRVQHRSALFDQTQQTVVPATPAVEARKSVNTTRNNYRHSLFDRTQQTQIPAAPAVTNKVNLTRDSFNHSLFDETQQTQIPATPAVSSTPNLTRSRHHHHHFDRTQQTQIPASPTADVQNSPGYEGRLVEEAARENAQFRFSTFRREPEAEDSTLHGADLPSFHFSSPMASSTPRASRLNGKFGGRSSLFESTVVPFNNTYADEDEEDADNTVLPANQTLPSPPSSPPPIKVTRNERPGSGQSSLSSQQGSATKRGTRRRRGSLDPIDEVSGGRSYIKLTVPEDVVKITETPPQTAGDKSSATGGEDVTEDVGSDVERRRMIRNALEWKGSSTRTSLARGNRLASSRRSGGENSRIQPAASRNSSVINPVSQDEPTETLDWLNAANFATPQVRPTGSGVFGYRNTGFGGSKANPDETDAGDETIIPAQTARQTRPPSRAAKVDSPPRSRVSLFSTTLRDLPDPGNISPPRYTSPPRQKSPPRPKSPIRQKPPTPIPERQPSPQAPSPRRDVPPEEESTADVTKEMEIVGTPVVVLKRSRRNREPSLSPEEVAANETIVRDAMSALSRVQSPASDNTGDRKGKGKATEEPRGREPARPSDTAYPGSSFASRYGLAEKLGSVGSHRPISSYLAGKEREQEPQKPQQPPPAPAPAPATQPLEGPPSRGKQVPSTRASSPKRWTRLSDALSPRKDRRGMSDLASTNAPPQQAKTGPADAALSNTDSAAFRTSSTASSNTEARPVPSRRPTPPPPPPRPSTPESRKNKAHLYEKNNLESPTNSDYEAFNDDYEGVSQYIKNVPSQSLPQTSQPEQKKATTNLPASTTAAATSTSNETRKNITGNTITPTTSSTQEQPTRGRSRSSAPTLSSSSEKAKRPILQDNDSTEDSIVQLLANDTDYQSLLGITPNIPAEDNNTVENEYQISPISLPRRTKAEDGDQEYEADPRFIRRLKEAEVALLGKMNNKLQTLQLELRSTKRGIETIEKRLEEQDGGEEFDPDATGFADQTVTDWTEDEKADLKKAIEDNKVLTAKRILEERIKRSKKSKHKWRKGSRFLCWSMGAMCALAALLALELVLLMITARVPCRTNTEFTDSLCTLRSLPIPGFMFPVDGLPYLPLGSPLLGIIYSNLSWIGRVGIKVGVKKLAGWSWEVVLGWWGLIRSLMYGLWRTMLAVFGVIGGFSSVLGGIGSFLATLFTPAASNGTVSSSISLPATQSSTPTTSNPVLSNLATLGEDEEIIVYDAGWQRVSSQDTQKKEEDEWWKEAGSNEKVVAKEYDPRTGQAKDPAQSEDDSGWKPITGSGGYVVEEEVEYI